MPTQYSYTSGTHEQYYLDGNAIAGTLSGIFAADLTGCGCRCGACGVIEPLARALV